MRTGLRAVAAIALLIGFYVLGIGLFAAVVGLDVLVLHSQSPALGLSLGLVLTALVVFAVGRPFYASIHLPAPKISGVAVLETEQPALWAAVRKAAAAAGTAPADHVWIDSRLNAAVIEEVRWLGLRSGRRHLIIGAPLLIALSPAQLDAVLAHEFGHFARHHARLSPVIMRGRAGLIKALNTAGFFTSGSVTTGRWLLHLQWTAQWLIHAYAVRYLTVTRKISRAQEYAADRISAELCGRDVAAGAIAELPIYHAGYQYFRTHFADAAVGLGFVPRPELVFPGFGTMLDQPGWRSMLATDRRATSTSTSRQPSARFDSHPSTAERVAALRALPDDGRTPETSAARAVALLTDAPTLLAAVADKDESRLDKAPADWDTLADARARAQTRQAAGPLVDAMRLLGHRTPTLSDVFDYIESGRMETLLYRMLTPTQSRYAPPGPVALEIGTKALSTALPAWITSELAEAGLTRWHHSWSTAPTRDLAATPAGLDAALTTLLTAAPPEAAPAAAALRKILAEAGVPV